MNTIVAIATALAKSAISIIRLSGQDSLNILNKLLGNAKKKSIEPRKATLRSLYDQNGNMLDKAIIIYFQAPFSFNGEDIVEIQSHGGVLIAQEILKTCLHFGASLAKPGEFSMRALKNNKLDLVELEATIALINNTNTNLTKLLMRNLNGECTKMLDDIRIKILEIIAQIEVNIDYSDEDLSADILEGSLQTLQAITHKFQAILESTKHYNRLQNAKLCILGKPNVGKSSLLNLLLMKERAIVSDNAGTTRDAITEVIDIDGNLVSIADTAGIHTSNNAIEIQGIERSFEYAKESDILLGVFDLSNPMDKEDKEVLKFLQSPSMQEKFLLIILNKSDLPQKNTFDFSAFRTITVNTKDYHYAHTIKERIKEFLTMQIDQNTFVLTNSMQSNLLENAQKNLHNAASLLQSGLLELASYELTQSLVSLGQITKPYDVEDVLGSMFSQFCVGK